MRITSTRVTVTLCESEDTSLGSNGSTTILHKN